MTHREFHHDLKVFLREAMTGCSGQDDKVELIAHLQPNMGILAGEYIMESARYSLDLRMIGKARSRKMMEMILTYHSNTTPGGENKWNVGKWLYTPEGDIEEHLIWDIEWEDKNRKERELHKNSADVNIPKWHWER